MMVLSVVTMKSTINTSVTYIVRKVLTFYYDILRQSERYILKIPGCKS
jgi:hypothetical protein